MLYVRVVRLSIFYRTNIEHIHIVMLILSQTLSSTGSVHSKAVILYFAFSNQIFWCNVWPSLSTQTQIKMINPLEPYKYSPH